MSIVGGAREGCQKIPKKFLRSDGKCFGDPKDTIDTKQMKNHVYLLRFGHTSALLLKKKKSDTKRPFSEDPHLQKKHPRNQLILKHLMFQLSGKALQGATPTAGTPAAECRHSYCRRYNCRRKLRKKHCRNQLQAQRRQM